MIEFSDIQIRKIFSLLFLQTEASSCILDMYIGGKTALQMFLPRYNFDEFKFSLITGFQNRGNSPGFMDTVLIFLTILHGRI